MGRRSAASREEQMGAAGRGLRSGVCVRSVSGRQARRRYREQPRYGPRGDAVGDDLFRKEREVWYEKFTGRSITGVSLEKQNNLCDAIARRFRSYTDGRSDR